MRLRKKEEFPPIDLDNMELSLTLFEETAERYGISSEKLLYSHALIVIGYDITHRFQAQRPGPKTYQKLKEFLLDRYQPEIPCHKKSHPKTTFVQALTNAEDRILGSSQDELLKAAIIDNAPPDMRHSLRRMVHKTYKDFKIEASSIFKAHARGPETSRQMGNYKAAATKTNTYGNNINQKSADPKPRDAQPPPGEKGICFYHNTHGSKVFKCEGEWCIFYPATAKPPTYHTR